MNRLERLKRGFAAAGIRPNARLGQNFLLDVNQVRFIARQAELDARDVVLEVGPGTGFLSKEILAAGATLVAVEYDRKLFEYASQELRTAPEDRFRPLPGGGFSADGTGDGSAACPVSPPPAPPPPPGAGRRRPDGTPDVVLLHTDILAGKNAVNPHVLEAVRAALDRRLALDPGAGRLKCVSNLPYSAGAPFLMNLFASEFPWERAVFLIQWEVAEKMCARPGSAAYGGLAVTVALGGSAKIIRKVPPPVFWPRPRVDSAVARVDFHPAAERLALPWKALRAVTSAAFSGRRKRLANALKGIVAREAVEAWLAAEKLDPETRGQTLSPRQFLALARLRDCPKTSCASPGGVESANSHIFC